MYYFIKKSTLYSLTRPYIIDYFALQIFKNVFFFQKKSIKGHSRVKGHILKTSIIRFIHFPNQ